jgi:hypothetical protein
VRRLIERLRGSWRKPALQEIAKAEFKLLLVLATFVIDEADT